MDQKKTGMTPAVEDGYTAGKLEGLIELKCVLVKFVDGRGQEGVKIGFVLPGKDGDVYFLDTRNTSMRPAQTWLKKAIQKRLGHTE